MQSIEALIGDTPRSEHRAIAVVTVIHALFVLGCWAAVFLANIDIPFSARVWLLFAWAWVAWPIYLLVRARSSRPMWIAVALGAVALIPTATTIFAFTTWSIGGFAP